MNAIISSSMHAEKRRQKSVTKIFGLTILVFALFAACQKKEKPFDASGAFEAEETIISAEAQGVLKAFTIEEGETLQAGEPIGFVDSTQLYLTKKQLEAQIVALIGRKPNIPVQLAALQEQLRTAEREQLRITQLVKGDAATPKQLDDINAQIDVLRSQIEAQKSTLHISSSGINKEVVPLQLQLEQLEDQLAKCKIINPLAGTVLTKYTEQYEMVSIGKPLYKIADISTILLRAYITGNQLPLVTLNQKLTVLTDDGEGGFHQAEGTVTWVSDQAEFTPKTIQTKDERANMVYAIKVKVRNDGRYKPGMYGEIKF